MRPFSGRKKGPKSVNPNSWGSHFWGPFCVRKMDLKMRPLLWRAEGTAMSSEATGDGAPQHKKWALPLFASLPTPAPTPPCMHNDHDTLLHETSSPPCRAAKASRLRGNGSRAHCEARMHTPTCTLFHAAEDASLLPLLTADPACLHLRWERKRVVHSQSQHASRQALLRCPGRKHQRGFSHADVVACATVPCRA